MFTAIKRWFHNNFRKPAERTDAVSETFATTAEKRRNALRAVLQKRGHTTHFRNEALMVLDSVLRTQTLPFGYFDVLIRNGSLGFRDVIVERRDEHGWVWPTYQSPMHWLMNAFHEDFDAGEREQVLGSSIFEQTMVRVFQNITTAEVDNAIDVIGEGGYHAPMIEGLQYIATRYTKDAVEKELRRQQAELEARCRAPAIP